MDILPADKLKTIKDFRLKVKNKNSFESCAVLYDMVKNGEMTKEQFEYAVMYLAAN